MKKCSLISVLMCAHTCAQAWHKGNVVRERKRERERVPPFPPKKI